MTTASKIFSFKGRASSRSFAACLWIWIGLYLWLAACTVAAASLGNQVLSPFSVLQSVRVPQEIASAAIVVLVPTLPVLIVGIVAPLVRRLHDLNLPGILILIFFALTYFSPYPDQPEWFVLLPPPGTLFRILLMILIPGKTGANSYGPDPQAPATVKGL